MERSKTKHSICYFSVRISTPFLSSASHRIYRILVIVFSSVFSSKEPFNLEKQKLLAERMKILKNSQ